MVSDVELLFFVSEKPLDRRKAEDCRVIFSDGIALEQGGERIEGIDRLARICQERHL